MAEIDKAVKINGFKFRSWKQADGYWSDPFEPFDFWSRTFLAQGTEVMEETEQADMIEAIKKNKDVKFKDQDLSELSREILKDNKIEIDDVQDDRNE